VEREVLRGAHLFILPIDTQEDLELVAGRNGIYFSQCSVAWGGFPQSRGSGCCSLILVYALFLLDGGRRRRGKNKKKKKRERERNHCGGGGFPGAEPTLLVVPWFTAVRCN
jgi:hypothetical protein